MVIPALLAFVGPEEGAGYFVGWFTLALLNAGLAQGKNRSGLIWFLISLLVGPLATFVLVVFFPKRRDDRELMVD